jgi:hypothetical protein
MDSAKKRVVIGDVSVARPSYSPSICVCRAFCSVFGWLIDTAQKFSILNNDEII